MSMRIFSGIQDFLGLHDPSTAGISSADHRFAGMPDSAGESGVGSWSSDGLAQGSIVTPMTVANEHERIGKCSHNRHVHFPPEDKIVSGYHEPKKPPLFDETRSVDIEEIQQAYRMACMTNRLFPDQNVEEQIKTFHRFGSVRQESLSLKGQRMSNDHINCLEDIFRRVQFDVVDFQYTFLDDDMAVSLGEMIEFYESAVKLNISFNNEIKMRGWQAICRAVKNNPCLEELNMRYSAINEKVLSLLARTLRSQPSLVSLHLENVELTGKKMLLLSCGLKPNTVLRELYLGECGLVAADGTHLYQLITSNTALQMLDLRHNRLGDEGFRHICDALKHPDTIARSSLSALVMWNNGITSASMDCLAHALKNNPKLETLNIGKNALSVEGINALKPALMTGGGMIQRLGLQHTKLNCQCAIALAECIADNSVLVRIDLRENDGIALAGLMALHMAMRVNTSITSLDLDQSCTHSKNNKVADHQGQFQSMYDEIQILCQQNRQNALKKLSVQSAASSSAPSDHEDVEKSKDEEEAEKMKLSEGGSKETGEESEVEKISDSPVAEASNSSEIQCAEEQLTLSIPKHWRRQKERDLKKFHRSASLTCTEMVEDLTERVKQMHSSTGSLEDSVAASVATVKKPVVVENRPSISNISKCEWTRSPSLPDLPKSTENGTVTPVRRAGRRFSVSPSTSEAAFYSPPSRFKVQTVPSKPSTLTLSPTTGIPQLKVSPLAECPTGSSLTWHSGDAPRGLVILPSTSKAVVPSKVPKNEAKAPPKENDAQITECVKSVVNDLVNYCVYEVDGTTKDTSTVSTQVERSGSVGPSIKRATDSLERRKKTTPLNSSGPPPPVVESEVEATEVVQATVRHLVREVLRLERDEVAGKLQRKRNSMRRTNGVSPP